MSPGPLSTAVTVLGVYASRLGLDFLTGTACPPCTNSCECICPQPRWTVSFVFGSFASGLLVGVALTIACRRRRAAPVASSAADSSSGAITEEPEASPAGPRRRLGRGSLITAP